MKGKLQTGMEFFLLPSSSATYAASAFAVLLFLYSLLWISTSFRKKSVGQKIAAPEAAGAWPVIGHLHLLGGSQLPHRKLGNMADKHGPIFTIKLGMHRTLVVSNPAMARECLTTHDKVFASRSRAVGVEHMAYNYAMFGFAPYGPYWRHVRKIAVTHLLSSHRLETLKHVFESQVKAAVNDIYRRWSGASGGGGGSNAVLVDMNEWFGDINLKVILRVVIGERCLEDSSAADHRFRRALEEFFRLMGLFVVGDAVPFLRWLDVGGYEREMKRTALELDRVMEECLEEHKEKRPVSAEDGVDFMGVMLSVLERDDAVSRLSDYGVDTVNKSTCLALVLGGSDTSTVTLEWALCLLLNNPHTLKKAQQELDAQVGRQQQLQGTHIKHLVYIQAIIKETLRLYPAAPLGAPHESIEDCTVGDHHVPVGTRLVVNLWKVHRDPQVWPNPDEFRPERFLTTHKDVDLKGQHFELIPFGSGRRMCPGVSFALQVMHFTLANLLHGFEIATPDGGPVDMGERFGQTIAKVTPLEVLLSPRLPSHLYV
ncbi:cytochrome P450 CYP82D47-like [Malania oleifera]|uniref:cytochrome P450 CYP82D47-like n=1 Tax=Malania oleifera TaxID=397392 RepID=UPI0025AE861C|nr:cytochrome P450 CYP82D47-like [Malania oleifera]